MRIPLSWLKEYVTLSLSPAEIAHMLTMAGLEVDQVEIVGENLKEIVVARVLEASKHPNAEKLMVAKVSDGKQTYQIVCGAPNCHAGLKTALARVGTTLGVEKEKFTIKKAKLRGIESEGMLCSEKELGLSEEHEGIIELPEELPEGMLLSDHFADVYFDISLTPNLSHCTSVLGVARELAAITNQSLRIPPLVMGIEKEAIEDFLQVRVIDKEACPRYACRLIRGVTVGPSPDWLKNRLEKCGVRSVNTVVDVTNYLLLEMGHPLHAFDYDKLGGHEIIVRKAKEGESIQTLDGKERILQSSMLLICDGKDPAAIAGVMGGSNSEIQGQTRNIVLEVAYFDPSSIRKTSKQLGLQTDASKRFERGTDPNQLIAVLDRAALLIQKIAGGEIAKGRIDLQSKEFPEAVVSCRLSRSNQLLGRVFSRGEVEDVFRRLRFTHQWDGQDQFIVDVPTYRNDIKSEIDLIEEIARLYGYENIPREGGHYQASSLPSTPLYLFENQVRTRLIGEGLQEFLTCDLIGPALLEVVHGKTIEDPSFVKVLNPVSIEQSILRTSLLPGLLQVVKYNFDHQMRNVCGFEIGRIHFREGEQFKEQPVTALLLSGEVQAQHWSQKSREVDFYDLKGMVENLLTAFGITNYHFKNLGLPTFHTGRQASVFVGSLEIGSFGEIHPAIQRRLDLPQRILFGEFNLSDLMKTANLLEHMKPLSIYPCSERDWTVTVKESIPYSEILDTIQKQHSTLLESVTLIDIYRGDKVAAGDQNMTLHFVYRDLLKTIEQDVVKAEHERLTKAVLETITP